MTDKTKAGASPQLKWNQDWSNEMKHKSNTMRGHANPLRMVWLRMSLALFCLLPLGAAAYTFAPSIMTLAPSGARSSGFFRLENKAMKAVAIELAIYECHKDIDGKTLKGKDVSDDFIIYPAQVILMPGDEVNVQVRWVGADASATEGAYTIVARELPLPRKPGEEKQAGVRVMVMVLVNYEGRIYVTPKGAKPDVVVESVEQRTQGDSVGGGATNVLEVICANKGTARKEMATMSLVLTPVDETGVPLKKQAVTVTSADVPRLKTHLLVGDRRRFVIPRPVGFPPGQVTCVLKE